MNLQQLVEEFVTEMEKGEVLHSSVKTTRLIWRYKRFMDSFGDRNPESLTQDEITNWLRPIGAITHRRDLVRLFRYAVSRGVMTHNPADTPVQKPPRTHFLTSKLIP